MSKENNLFDDNASIYNFSSLTNKKALVSGIGGGSYIVGVLEFLKDKNPSAKITLWCCRIT